MKKFLDRIEAKYPFLDYSNYKCSHISDWVTLGCNIHGQFTRPVYKILYANTDNLCPKCNKLAANEKASQTLKNKDGFVDYCKSKCLAKHGVDNTSKLPEFKEKIKNGKAHRTKEQDQITNAKISETLSKYYESDQYREDLANHKLSIEISYNRKVLDKNLSKFSKLFYTERISRYNTVTHDQFKFIQEIDSMKSKNIYLKSIEHILTKLNLSYTINYKLDNMYELDFYIPEFHIGIEYNGIYWHCTDFKDQFYHQEKVKMCFNREINLLSIWENFGLKYEDLKNMITTFINSEIKLGEYEIDLNREKLYSENTEIIKFKPAKKVKVGKLDYYDCGRALVRRK